MILQIYIFLLGLVFGSFFNACIFRLPREKTILNRSYCPQCEKKICWYDNIPLLSFLLLRGKCRNCSKKISWRYPLVELFTGILWLWLYQKFGLNWFFVHSVIFLSLLFVASIIDLETGLLPDVLTLPGMLLGVTFAVADPSLIEQGSYFAAFIQSFGGLLIGGGMILLTGWIGDVIFKKESMGGGDVKFLAMIGAFVGIPKVIFAFFLAPFFALPIALYAKFVIKRETIPFGPYLALGGAAIYLFGNEIINTVYK